MPADTKNYFEILNSIDVNEKVETKGRYKYLSWAYAWGVLKTLYPESTYTVYESTSGLNYHTDGRTAWVKTGVTVNGIEHIEYLPVMDSANRSLPLEKITSFEVNKTIQRSLTKAVARHGLGLYIYAGEDLPEATDGNQEPQKTAPKKATAKQPTPAPAPAPASQPKQAPAQQQTTKQQPKQEEWPERVALREYIHEHGLDGYAIAEACKLGPKSTREDYTAALDYAKKTREEISRTAYVEAMVGGAGNDTQG